MNNSGVVKAMFEVIRAIDNLEYDREEDILCLVSKSLEDLKEGIDSEYNSECKVYISFTEEEISAVNKAIAYRVFKDVKKDSMSLSCPTCGRFIVDMLINEDISTYPRFCGMCGQKLSYKGV